MRKNTKPSRARSVQPRLRILCRGGVALGPGKAELLAWIGQTGSINQAAKQMGMSYMRAWSLVQTMNRCFKGPLVLAGRGGPGGGGAELTPMGQRVLGLYRQMEQDSLKIVRANWQALRKLLRH